MHVVNMMKVAMVVQMNVIVMSIFGHMYHTFRAFGSLCEGDHLFGVGSFISFYFSVL